jgi:hypothetical protein
VHVLVKTLFYIQCGSRQGCTGTSGYFRATRSVLSQPRAMAALQLSLELVALVRVQSVWRRWRLQRGSVAECRWWQALEEVGRKQKRGHSCGPQPSWPCAPRARRRSITARRGAWRRRPTLGRWWTWHARAWPPTRRRACGRSGRGAAGQGSGRVHLGVLEAPTRAAALLPMGGSSAPGRWRGTVATAQAVRVGVHGPLGSGTGGGDGGGGDGASAAQG